MSRCDSRCRCYFAAKSLADELLERLVYIEDMLGRMRWAWDKNDSRHQRVVEEARVLREYIEAANRRFV